MVANHFRDQLPRLARGWRSPGRPESGQHDKRIWYSCRTTGWEISGDHRLARVGASIYTRPRTGRRGRLFFGSLNRARVVGQAQARVQRKFGLKKLYVGNLSYSCSEEELRTLFTQYGTVASAAVVMDRETGRSRGFGFVEMEDDNNATSAIEALNGAQHDGRTLNVNEARPREDRGRSRW